jgi:glycosyltransferase involved in cell wall biosynthesis
VSVIVPVRERRELLRALLEALAHQSFNDFEVVVVDDWSKDGTAEEVEKAAAEGLPAIVIQRPQGVGSFEARSLGVAVARGEYLAFTDSDCLPEPEWIAEGVAALDRGMDLVQGRTVPLRAPGLLEHSVGAGDEGLYNTCNIFYRRSAYERAGGFDGQAGRGLGFQVGTWTGLGFGVDTLLGWRVSRNGHALFVPTAVVHHQIVRPSLRELISRAWMTGAFPALVREVPELRQTLMAGGFFLGRRRIPFYATAMSLLLGRRRWAAGAAAAWVAVHAVNAARDRGRRQRISEVPIEMARDVVTGSALVAGSVRSRTVVL